MVETCSEIKLQKILLSYKVCGLMGRRMCPYVYAYTYVIYTGAHIGYVYGYRDTCMRT